MLAKVIDTLVVNAFSFYFGITTVFRLLNKVFTNGVKVLYRKDIVVPPALLSDKNFGTHHYLYLKERGIRLHYVEAGDTSMPLLLCLHGFPECWVSWRHQMKEFSSQFRVVAVDLRGYGDSDKPKKMSDYSSIEIAEDIKCFIEELEPVDGKCSLMGHDWGGIIGWRLVEKYPHLIHRHISINSPRLDVVNQVLRSSFSQMMKSWYVYVFRIPLLSELLLQVNDFELLKENYKGSKSLEESFTKEILDVYQYYWSKGLKYPIFYYNMALMDKSDASQSDEKIDIPTLIIWGKKDHFLSAEIPKRLIHLCSDVQLKEIETAGHFVHEEEPITVNKIIWNYIKITP